jgi:hypothetical protein
MLSDLSYTYVYYTFLIALQRTAGDFIHIMPGPIHITRIFNNLSLIIKIMEHVILIRLIYFAYIESTHLIISSNLYLIIYLIIFIWSILT